MKDDVRILWSTLDANGNAKGYEVCAGCDRPLARHFGDKGRCHSRMLRPGGGGDIDCKRLRALREGRTP